jgi:hypothetical protein
MAGDLCIMKYYCAYCGKKVKRCRGCDCMGKPRYSLANADSNQPFYVGPDMRIYVKDKKGIYYGDGYKIMGTILASRENKPPIYEKANRCEVRGGLKYDDGKLRWDLLPYDAIEKVVEILTYGANKYEANNWQEVESSRYEAAMMRHFVAYMKGEKRDFESGFTHLAHMACNALFLLWQDMQRVEPSLPQCDKKEDSFIRWEGY